VNGWTRLTVNTLVDPQTYELWGTVYARWTINRDGIEKYSIQPVKAACRPRAAPRVRGPGVPYSIKLKTLVLDVLCFSILVLHLNVPECIVVLEDRQEIVYHLHVHGNG
jgi:hypothetical protein